MQRGPSDNSPYVPNTAKRNLWPWRFGGVFLYFIIIWPLTSVIFAPAELHAVDIFNNVATLGLWSGALITSIEMTVEFVVIGMILAVLTCIVIWICGHNNQTVNNKGTLCRGIIDALTITLALSAGIALELPAVLAHPLFTIARSFPVWLVTALLLLMPVGMTIATGRNNAPFATTGRSLIAVAVIVGLGWVLARFPPVGIQAGGAASNQRVLLGLDSLSIADDLRPLKGWANQSDGVFHEKAVTPGLLTNSVWPAIVSSRLPSESGCYFIYQAPDWKKLGSNIVLRANDAGLETHSYFSDQFTLLVGSDLPFSRNHSGPRGWKQPISAAVKDASIFLPVILPWLPSIPGAIYPANQAGTFAFSLRGELASILGGKRTSNGSLVLGHVDYLHQARFPNYSELTTTQRIAVYAAPLTGIVDKSIDWQYPEAVGDPIGLYRWKIRNLLMILQEAAALTDVLNPRRHNQVAIFSDHGARTGLQEGGFAYPKFYRVPLVTFGISGRNPLAPISLMDLPALIGLQDPLRLAPFPLVVEYANVTGTEWTQLTKTSRVSADGGIQLDPIVLVQLGQRLLSANVSSEIPFYVPVPTKPVAEQQPQSSALFYLVDIVTGHL